MVVRVAKKVKTESKKSLFDDVRFSDMGNTYDDIFSTFISEKNTLVFTENHKQIVDLYNIINCMIK